MPRKPSKRWMLTSITLLDQKEYKLFCVFERGEGEQKLQVYNGYGWDDVELPYDLKQQNEEE